MKLSALQLSELLEGFDGEALAAQVSCPVCGSDSSVDDTAFTIHPERPLAVDLRKCIRCRHGWIDPLPAQAFLNYLYGRGSRSVIGAEQAKTELTIPEAIAACEAATLPATRDSLPGDRRWPRTALSPFCRCGLERGRRRSG